MIMEEDKILVCSKCDIDWTEVHCPRPATCMRYYTGQHGHKVIFLFCDECWAKPEPMSNLRNLERIFRKEPLPPPPLTHTVEEDEFFERLDDATKEDYNRRWNEMIKK